jgi:signal transduction histidine kinase
MIVGLKVDQEVVDKEAILEALAFVAERFLKYPVEEALPLALTQLGSAVHVARVAVISNNPDANGHPHPALHLEWTAPGVPSSEELGVPARDWDMNGLERWAELLPQNRPVAGPVSSFPASEHAPLRRLLIRSILVIPVFVENCWWGGIGFADNERERIWTDAEVDLLRVAAGLLGVAIGRRRTEEEQCRLHEALRQSQKLKSLGVLAGGLAHELNQPVQAVQGFAQRILRHHDDRVGQHADELEIILQATHRMDRIIQNIRLFAGERPLSPQLLDPTQPLEDALLLLGDSTEDDQISVRWTERPVDLPPVHIDRTLMGQVYLNLLLNARDELKELPGGVTRRIDLSGAVSDGQILVSVCDTGCGLSPEHEERIFEPFFTTKKVGQGLGLGLAIAHGIVVEHGGRLHYSLADGGGARFTVALPVPADDPI